MKNWNVHQQAGWKPGQLQPITAVLASTEVAHCSVRFGCQAGFTWMCVGGLLRNCWRARMSWYLVRVRRSRWDSSRNWVRRAVTLSRTWGWQKDWQMSPHTIFKGNFPLQNARPERHHSFQRSHFRPNTKQSYCWPNNQKHGRFCCLVKKWGLVHKAAGFHNCNNPVLTESSQTTTFRSK